MWISWSCCILTPCWVSTPCELCVSWSQCTYRLVALNTSDLCHSFPEWLVQCYRSVHTRALCPYLALVLRCGCGRELCWSLAGMGFVLHKKEPIQIKLHPREGGAPSIGSPSLSVLCGNIHCQGNQASSCVWFHGLTQQHCIILPVFKITWVTHNYARHTLVYWNFPLQANRINIHTQLVHSPRAYYNHLLSCQQMIHNKWTI